MFSATKKDEKWLKSVYLERFFDYNWVKRLLV
jgi:hypothetical protein